MGTRTKRQARMSHNERLIISECEIDKRTSHSAQGSALLDTTLNNIVRYKNRPYLTTLLINNVESNKRR